MNVYAGQSLEKRKALWSYISFVLRNWEGSTFIFGDLNEVKHSAERNGSRFNQQGANELNDFIKSNDLDDLKIGGREFTWFNKRGTKMSKLDWILISKGVDEIWQNLEVVVESRINSDHTPLILK